MSRADILSLDRRWVFEVIFHPRDEEGRLLDRDEAQRQRPQGQAEQWRILLRGRGWPEHRIAAKLQELGGRK